MSTTHINTDALVLCPNETDISWLHFTIRSQGLSTTFCHSRHDLRQAIEQRQYRLLIWNKADDIMDMRDFCREVRSKDHDSIALVITDQHLESDHISCLELGASDYLGNMYSSEELKARLRAHLFRTESLFQMLNRENQEQQIFCRGLSININRREVSFMGQRIELTAKEFDLLQTLISRPGQVFNRNQLLDAVWGQANESYAHTVSTHINRLRTKFEMISTDVKLIHTLWGVGYKFCDCYEPSTQENLNT